MTTNPNDSAYATSGIIDQHGNEGHSGLTKRELFAAMAMQGLISKIPLHDREGKMGIHAPTIEEIHGVRKQVAQSATDYADALIEALNEGEAKP